MHLEERRICYTNHELVNALALYCESESRDFPHDPSTHVTYSNSPALKVTVSNWNTRNGVIDFPEPEIATALVMFSEKLGISVPDQAARSLEIGGDTIVFVMQIEHGA